MNRDRIYGPASTSAPVIAEPCTECRGFANVPGRDRRGNPIRGRCRACGGDGTLAAQETVRLGMIERRTLSDIGVHAGIDFGVDVTPSAPCIVPKGAPLTPDVFRRCIAEFAPNYALHAETFEKPLRVDWMDITPEAGCDSVVTYRPTPGPSEPAPTADVLPLWECDADGDWFRGDNGRAKVWVIAEGVGFEPGWFGEDVQARRAPILPTAEAAMRHADEMALEAGSVLPWDSMVPDPELAEVLAGAEFRRRRDDVGWVDMVLFDKATNDAALPLFHRIPFGMPRPAAARAFARLLRAHGAVVTEAA